MRSGRRSQLNNFIGSSAVLGVGNCMIGCGLGCWELYDWCISIGLRIQHFNPNGHNFVTSLSLLWVPKCNSKTLDGSMGNDIKYGI